MKLHLEREALLQELGPMQGIVERRSTVPALTHVWLEAKPDGLAIAATDMDISLTSEIPAKVTERGSLTVHARKLHEIMRALSASEVEWAADERQTLSIVAGRSRFRVRGLPPSSFPTLPQLGNQPALFSVPMEEFRRWVSLVLFAVSGEQSRYQLSGALLKLVPGRLEFVATDGHRLAWLQVERKEISESCQILIPRKALQELLRLEGSGAVTVRKSEHYVSFHFPPRELCGRLLDGNFPDYEKVISRDADKFLEVDRREFLNAVERVSLLTGERNRGVRLRLENAESFEISAANPDLGEASEEVVCSYRGEPLAIAFNPDYLVDFLQAVSTAKVRFSMRDEMGQTIAEPMVEKEEAALPVGERYRCVIMPMRL
jgi:DNA polymerase-3 subunit beta